MPSFDSVLGAKSYNDETPGLGYGMSLGLQESIWMVAQSRELAGKCLF
jgi:hypothetical protein